ncbi:60Kd inner membrane protein-domain-containing protein [Phycomyces blakesleeanus]|uniref:60Kd inner membrane protein-domain-containing protein n=1 Tax=Phycomyces blakesleeanus TaxID=4837 RepID=A0ABR3B8W1_PHYBL
MNSLLRGRLFSTSIGRMCYKYHARPLHPSIVPGQPEKNPSLPLPLLMSQPFLAMNPTVASEVALPSVLAANQTILDTIHGAGLPWWATIVVATITLRTSMTLPIAIYQQRSMSKMIELAPMVQSWAETLKVSVARESRELGYEKYAQELNKQYRKKVNYLYAHHGCARWKVFLLPWVQLPLFASMSLTLRHMSGLPLPWWGQLTEGPIQGLDSGGLSWFVDLTIPDPTWVFPVLIGAGNLLNVELVKLVS